MRQHTLQRVVRLSELPLLLPVELACIYYYIYYINSPLEHAYTTIFTRYTRLLSTRILLYILHTLAS